MLTGAVFVPETPLLVPDIARAAAGELADLTAACRSAIRRFAAPGLCWLVVGAGDQEARVPGGTRGSFAGFGADVPVVLGSGPGGSDDLPASLCVGAWLLADAIGTRRAAGWTVVDGARTTPGDADVLLVVGDGSACRSTAAPGYFNAAAEPFDAAVAAALRSGDPAVLAGLDAGAAAQVLCGGVPAWHAAAGLLAAGLAATGSWRAELSYDAAPYGVGYFVATWTRSP